MTPDDLKELLEDSRSRRIDVRELTLADRLDDDEDKLRGRILR